MGFPFFVNCISGAGAACIDGAGAAGVGIDTLSITDDAPSSAAFSPAFSSPARRTTVRRIVRRALASRAPLARVARIEVVANVNIIASSVCAPRGDE
jgi:hypothetical protein